MSQIDFTQLLSAETLQQHQRQAQADRIKATCRARILAVVDQTRQMNLTAAAAAGGMSPGQSDAWKALLGWIGDMRGACAAHVAQAVNMAAGAAPDDPEALSWPSVPEAAQAVL